jgi:hypothetical protein
MGINFYLATPRRMEAHNWYIPHCTEYPQWANGPPGDYGTWPGSVLHIGKSSGGWCFGLHVFPDFGISSLDDWKAKWSEGLIIDECERVISPKSMTRIIEDRHGIQHNDTWFRDIQRFGYNSEADFHRRNHSQPGPHDLVRHKLGKHCIGHGEGTWDLIVGEFC